MQHGKRFVISSASERADKDIPKPIEDESYVRVCVTYNINRDPIYYVNDARVYATSSMVEALFKEFAVVDLDENISYNGDNGPCLCSGQFRCFAEWDHERSYYMQKDYFEQMIAETSSLKLVGAQEFYENKNSYEVFMRQEKDFYISHETSYVQGDLRSALKDFARKNNLNNFRVNGWVLKKVIDQSPNISIIDIYDSHFEDDDIPGFVNLIFSKENGVWTGYAHFADYSVPDDPWYHDFKVSIEGDLLESLESSGLPFEYTDRDEQYYENKFRNSMKGYLAGCSEEASSTDLENQE